MNERLRFDVMVIGGGLVGSSAALMLARRGQKVGLFERRFCGAQASGVNYGGVRRQGRSAGQLPLAVRARRIWDQLPGLIGTDGEFVVSGHLRLARSEADLAALESYAQLANPYGLDLQVSSGSSFRRRYPWLGPSATGGSLCPGDGHANPRIVSPAFARAARAAGADVREQTEVVSIARDGEQFVIGARHDSGAMIEARADWLINSAGAWGNTVAGFFGDAVPMEPIYPNMWVTEPLPFFIDHNLGVYGGGIYARQVSRGNVVIGGGRGSGNGEYAQPLTETTRTVIRAAIELLPGLENALLLRSWTGVEGATPDDNPVIGSSPGTPRLLHAFGFSGGGFLLAPGVGEVLADLVIDGGTSTPMDAFSPGRWAAPQPE